MMLVAWGQGHWRHAPRTGSCCQPRIDIHPEDQGFQDSGLDHDCAADAPVPHRSAIDKVAERVLPRQERERADVEQVVKPLLGG
jgi:hypothetical protein